jgi:hypothetical protein
MNSAHPDYVRPNRSRLSRVRPRGLRKPSAGQGAGRSAFASHNGVSTSPGDPSLVSQPSAASPTRGGWAAGLREAGSFSYRLIAGEIRRVKSSARERRTLDAADFSPSLSGESIESRKNLGEAPSHSGRRPPTADERSNPEKGPFGALPCCWTCVGRVGAGAPTSLANRLICSGFVEPAVGLEPTTC